MSISKFVQKYFQYLDSPDNYFIEFKFESDSHDNNVKFKVTGNAETGFKYSVEVLNAQNLLQDAYHLHSCGKTFTLPQLPFDSYNRLEGSLQLC